MSREKILAAVRANKPAERALPEVNIPVSYDNLIEKYTQVASAIGAKVVEVGSLEEVKEHLKSLAEKGRVVSPLAALSGFAETDWAASDPHELQNVELAVIQAWFGVAENGALWITEERVKQRVLPFICQHLAILVERHKILPTMHQAYEHISDSDYGYGAFIAGPSKTADIEQSLVLGAHGPRSLTVFILPSEIS